MNNYDTVEVNELIINLKLIVVKFKKRKSCSLNDLINDNLITYIFEDRVFKGLCCSVVLLTLCDDIGYSIYKLRI